MVYTFNSGAHRPIGALAIITVLASGVTCPIGRAQAETVELILRNGDSLKGTIVKEESNGDVTVLIHPDLGRMEIKKAALKPRTTRPWSASLSAGINSSNTDDDLSAGGALTLSAKYKQNKDELTFNGQAHYDVSRDVGETENSVDTNEGNAELRYSRQLKGDLSTYISGRYNYDALNAIGTDTVVGSIGLGLDVVKTPTTVVNLSIGPSLQQLWGGSGCINDPVCGNLYAASTARAHMEWKPNKNIKLSLTNQFTGAYVNGLSPSNTFSGTLKVFPTGNQSFFTSFSAQTIYNSLQTPQINNSMSIQLGTELK